MELRNDAATAARRFRVREHGHGSRLHGADGLTPHKIFLLLRVLSGRGLHPLEHAAHEGVELHVGGPCESRKYAEQREERELRVVEVIAAEVRVEERALSSLGVKASQDDEPDDDGAADGTEEAFPVATRQEVRRSYLRVCVWGHGQSGHEAIRGRLRGKALGEWPTSMEKSTPPMGLVKVELTPTAQAAANTCRLSVPLALRCAK
mmetsp:Transcript_27306/g.86027  ORF Transcript_27306/g.86027 Transcript_27306/m.86027 type:complete len:206 (+) Transcript_27306:2734-3351(+)